jgi:hypothetical protein
MEAVMYSEFNVENLAYEKYNKIDIKDDKGKIVGNQYRIPIKYQCGAGETQTTKSLAIDLPEVFSYQGIEEGEQNGNKTYTIKVSLPQEEETLVLTQKLLMFYAGCCSILDTCKNQYKKEIKQIQHFDKTNPAALFTNFVYIPMEDGNPVPGKSASLYLKLFYRNDPKTGVSKTTFNDLDGKEMDWSLLKDKRVKLIPRMKVQCLNISNRVTLKWFMTEAVVIKVEEKSKQSGQMSIIQRYNEKNPNAKVELQDQIAKLMSQKQVPMCMPVGGSVHTSGQTTGSSNVANTEKDSSNDLESFLSSNTLNTGVMAKLSGMGK